MKELSNYEAVSAGITIRREKVEYYNSFHKSLASTYASFPLFSTVALFAVGYNARKYPITAFAVASLSAIASGYYFLEEMDDDK